MPKGITTRGFYSSWFNEESGMWITPSEVYTKTTGDKCPEELTVHMRAKRNRIESYINLIF